MNTYKNRIGATSAEKTFELTKEGLSDGVSLWKYEEIDEVQLKFTPTRYYGGIYQCHVHSRYGTLVLSNRRYIKPLEFEYQNVQFNGFMREFHCALAKCKVVEFSTGMGKASFYLQLVAMLIFIPLMVFALVAMGRWLIAIGALAFFLYRLIPYFNKNKPGVYNPLSIPNRLLPS